MKLTIFKRLTIGYAAIIIIFILQGGYTIFTLKKLNHLTSTVVLIDSGIIKPTKHIVDMTLSQIGFDKKFLISNDHDFYAQFIKQHKSIIEYIKKTQDFVGVNDHIRQLFSQIIISQNKYSALFKKEAEHLKKKDAYPVNKYQKSKDKIIKSINGKLNEIIQSAGSERDNTICLAGLMVETVLKITILTAGITIFVGILISFLNTRNITRSIMQLQRKTKEISRGRFDKISDVVSPPEIKELADDFNKMCERLKELDEMKMDFISHVSHELRTPLTAIKEASSMLTEGVFANMPDKKNELLAIVQEECDRLIKSTNRILDLSCMEADMMGYRFKANDVFKIIQKCITKLTPIAKRKHIKLEFIPSSNLPLIKADHEGIYQVLENLVGNALKFTSENGSIIIRAFLVKVAGNNKFLKISVTDTGCGITKKNLKVIFNKFKRINIGIETARGTGLGLSICKHIIVAHGGKIWVESRPDEGSTFSFTLPLA